MADSKKAEAPAETPAKAPDVVAVPPKGKSSNKTLFIVLAVVAFFLILPGLIFGVAVFWLGRGDNSEKAAEKIISSATGSSVNIDSSNNSYSVKTKDGSEYSVGDKQDYADDFPNAVPKYPGGTVTSNLRTKNDSGTYWGNTVETSDGATKVVDYFKDKLSGWSNEAEYSYNDSTSLSYKKDDLTLLLTVSETDGKTTISYSVNQDTKTNN